MDPTPITPLPPAHPARARLVAAALVALLVLGAPGVSATARVTASGTSGDGPLRVLAPVREAPVPGATWVPPLDRPLDALGVLAPFDPPAEKWLAGHRGVDLAASPGETVHSPAPGVVTFTGPVAGRDVVVVLHDDGLRTSLEPVTGTVAPGTRLGGGQALGTVQSTSAPGASASVHGGHCADVCVHWGVRRGERYLDPLALLRDRPPIVLLPLA